MVAGLRRKGLGFEDFDNIGATLLAVSQVFLVDGAYEVLHNSLESEPDVVGLTYVYYVLITFTTTLVLFNLYVAVVVNTFQEVRTSRHAGEGGSSAECEENLKEENAVPTTEEAPTAVTEQNSEGSEADSEVPSLISNLAGALVRQKRFELLISATIAVHTLAMSTDTDEASWLPRDVLLIIYFVSTAVLAVEWLLRCTAESASVAFFVNPFHALEALLICCGAAGLLTGSRILTLLPSIRVLRLCKYSATLQDLLEDCVETQRSFLYLILFMTLVGLCFAVVGRYVFRADMDSITRFNFGSLDRAILTIFQLFTGDSWRQDQFHFDP